MMDSDAYTALWPLFENPLVIIALLLGLRVSSALRGPIRAAYTRLRAGSKSNHG